MPPNTFFRPSVPTTGLLIVDVQEKFRKAVPDFDSVVRGGELLARAFGLLGMPVYVTEQYPRGLGPTVPDILQALPSGTVPFTKMTFSCCGATRFRPALEERKTSGLVVCGIETHVCVYQTVLDLLASGMEVAVATDAVASRKEADRAVALRRMEQAGALLMTVEMVLFDLLYTAEAPMFKEIQRLVK